MLRHSLSAFNVKWFACFWLLVSATGLGLFLDWGTGAAALQKNADGQPSRPGQQAIAANPMTTAREGHTAILLQNGRVLVAGGRAGGTALNTAQLFDPATGNWSNTNNTLHTGRYGHSAVLLPNGTVMLIGGQTSDGNSLQSVEIYNPSGNSWNIQANTPRLNISRARATATLLTNGRVLVAGGQSSPTVFPRSTEIYNPADNSWKTVAGGDLNDARSEHSATLISDGRVLVAGGANNTTQLKSSELFDPAVNRWRRVGELSVPRRLHTATLLPTGMVLIAGGLNGTTALNTAELFNKNLARWASTGNFGTARRGQTATLLPDGRVLVTGGLDGNGTPLTLAQVYDSANGAWSNALNQRIPNVTPANFTLVGARANHAATLLHNGRVLITGGLGGGSPLATAELYEYASGTWDTTKNKSTGATTKLATARIYHTTTLLGDGRVMVAGGADANGRPLQSTEIYDPATGIWSLGPPLSLPRREHTATLLPDGGILIVGGVGGANGTTRLANTDIYNPATGAWAPGPNTPAARVLHTATLLRDNPARVLVVGGEDGVSIPSANSVMIYNVATRTWSAGASLGTSANNPVRMYHTATLLPDGRVLIIGGLTGGTTFTALNRNAYYNPQNNTWTVSNSTGQRLRYGHTSTLLPNGRVFVANGRAGTSFANAGQLNSNAEIFDPGNDAWGGPALSTSAARLDHSATLLPTGKVLLVGGSTVSLSTGFTPSVIPTEIFDPTSLAAVETVRLSAEPALGRDGHTATLLPTGQLLIVGGRSEIGGAESILDRTDLYDVGLGSQPGWGPALTNVVSVGNLLTAVGVRFRGISEAGGHGAQNAPGDHPTLQIRSLGNEQISFLPPDATNGGWTNNRYTFPRITGFPVGPALLTVFTNGISGVSVVVGGSGSLDELVGSVLGSISGRVSYHNGEGIVASVTLSPTNDAPAGCSPTQTITSAPTGEFTFPNLIIFPRAPVDTTTFPTITCPPNLVGGVAPGQNGAFGQYPAPTATGGTPVCTPASGSFFSVGTTTVNCSVSNQRGTANCSFTITVGFVPSITCPTNRTVLIPFNSTGSTVTYPAPTVSSPNSPATTSCIPPSGSFFPRGTTRVNCAASNTFGSSLCGFNVLVTSSSGPALSRLPFFWLDEPPAALPGTVDRPSDLPGSPTEMIEFTPAFPTRSNASSAPQARQQNTCRYEVRPSLTVGERTIGFVPAVRRFNLISEIVGDIGFSIVAEPQQTIPTQTCQHCTGATYVTNFFGGNKPTNSGVVSPAGTNANFVFSVPYADLGQNLQCLGDVPCTPGTPTKLGDACAEPNPDNQFFCQCTRKDGDLCVETVLGRSAIPISETTFVNNRFTAPVPFGANIRIKPESDIPGQLNFNYLKSPDNPGNGEIVKERVEFSSLDDDITAQALGNPVPQPGANPLNMTSARAGSGPLTLIVNGVNFIGGTLALWNGSPRQTLVDSATQLRVTIPPSDLLTPGTAQITLENPSPGGGISSSINFTVLPNTVNGQVRLSYGLTPKPVPGVNVVINPGNRTATTGGNGEFNIGNLGGGAFTLTAGKVGDIQAAISFNDALLVAQSLVGSVVLSEAQRIAANTDGSGGGGLSFNDALFIAQSLVGAAPANSRVGQWQFPTANLTLSNDAVSNLEAVLIGDVNGSWPTGTPGFNSIFDALPADSLRAVVRRPWESGLRASPAGKAQTINVSLAPVTAQPNSALTIPITVGNLTGQGVFGYDLDLVFDANVLQLQNPAQDAGGTISQGLFFAANPEPGRLRLIAFSTSPLTGSGTLLNLRFNVVGAAGSSTNLTWRKFTFNEGTPQALPTNGLVTVVAPVAVPVVTTVAATIGTTTATLVGTVNPNGGATQTSFEYDTNAAFTNSTTVSAQSLAAGNTAQNISANITGLTPGTTYFFRARANNSAGPATGASLSFTTTACGFTINPTSRSFNAGGGNDSVAVTAAAGCAWTAAANDSWITINSGASGNGNGTVTYSVAANTGGQRTGTMTIARQSFTVTQSAVPFPTISLSPASLNPAVGGSQSLIVNLSAAQSSAVNIALTSSNTALATVPASVSIPANGTAAGFNVSGVAAGGPVTITATLPANLGGGTATASVQVSTAVIVRLGAAAGSPGGTVTVPIEMVSTGNVNGLGFSLNFNSTILSAPQVALGSDAGGASLNANTSQTTQGRLGITLAMPSNQSFATGTRQILTVTFAIVAGTTATNTPLSFGSQPIAQEVADITANVLLANFQNGAVTINQGLEADVAPRPNGNGTLSLTDWVQTGRFVSGADTPAAGSEFQRADCAPKNSSGNGILSLTDWVQAGRYAAGLDEPVPAAGPTAPVSLFSFTGEDFATQLLKRLNWPDARTLRLRTDAEKTGAEGFVQIELQVELDALGGENAVGFSLNFDAARWRLLSASTEIEAATLLVNRTQLEDGKLGIGLALAPGEKLPAGRHPLVRVRFAPLAPFDQTPALSFGDAPVARELANALAEPLPLNFAREDELPLTVVSAADFSRRQLARESIAIAFGLNPATKAELLETQVFLIDQQGVEHRARLFSVSPEQVAFRIPAETALGWARLIVRNHSGAPLQTAVEIVESEPAIFFKLRR